MNFTWRLTDDGWILHSIVENKSTLDIYPTDDFYAEWVYMDTAVRPGKTRLLSKKGVTEAITLHRNHPADPNTFYWKGFQIVASSYNVVVSNREHSKGGFQSVKEAMELIDKIADQSGYD